MGEPGRYREEREGLSSRCSSLAFRAFRYPCRDGGLRSLGRRRPAQQPSNPSFQEGPGLSPNNVGVLVRPGLRIRDGHRRLELPGRVGT